MTTAFKGALALIGLKSGKQYNVPFSSTDAAALFSFDLTGQTVFRCPEPYMILDMTVYAATADVDKTATLKVDGTTFVMKVGILDIVSGVLARPKISTHPSIGANKDLTILGGAT